MNIDDTGALDRRAVWLLGGLLAVAGVVIFVAYPAPARVRAGESAFVSAPAVAAPPAPAPVAEEDPDAPPPEPEPFVETERVRGKVVFDEGSKALRVEDPFGEEVARIDLLNLSDQMVGSSFDAEAKVVLVDLKDGRRVEVPEDVYQGLPYRERYALYYPN